MARDPDEEALSWGDDRDATHVDPAAPAPERREERDDLAEAFPDAAAEAEGEATASRMEADAEPGLSSTGLVALGFIGGVYLLYAVGWLISVLRMGALVPDPLQSVLFQIVAVLAVAATPLWFAVTVVLSRPAVLRRGLVWLALGAVVLAPWPFILGV